MHGQKTIIVSLAFLLILYLAMPRIAQAYPYTSYMVWDFENNVDEWGGFWFPLSEYYPNGRSGENSTAQSVNGSYSLYFKADASLASDGWYGIKANGTITTYDWHFYFWIYMTSIASSGTYTGLVCGLYRTSPTIFWLVGFEPAGTGFRAGAYVGTDGWKASERFTYNATPTTFSMSTWYAFRLSHNYTASSCLLYWSTNALDWNYEGVSVNWVSSIPVYFRIDHQENCHIYYGYIDYMAVTDTEEMYAPYPPPPPEPPFSVVGQYTWLGIFMGGIVLMVWSPAWVAWKIKKKGIDPDTLERMGYALLLWLVGFGLFISWLYH